MSLKVKTVILLHQLFKITQLFSLKKNKIKVIKYDSVHVIFKVPKYRYIVQYTKNHLKTSLINPTLGTVVDLTSRELEASVTSGHE